MSKEEEKKGDVAAKISACLLGAFVADAACMGLEWIYDPNEMRTTVDSVEEPEFKDPPAPRYFSSKEFPGHYGPGMLSPYGEQLLFVAEYCAGAGYDLNKKDIGVPGALVLAALLPGATALKSCRCVCRSMCYVSKRV